ncbi:unnamed protein product [Eruca vesicaria subsp. sativa]|uniref:Uncharacterized protein n=1 Tax=Eruca vesicaria subsp. sativa TaxID=29727 RepID=A0ABC8ILS3_ERUVS|nr:unnamed protein product [Eruca vesicaria subsp. sativa]
MCDRQSRIGVDIFYSKPLFFIFLQECKKEVVSHLYPNQAITELPGDPLVDSINENLEALSSLSFDCCIYKVPDRLRRLNPDAYSPRVVSIGPLHHGKEELQAMEDHKLRYLQSFIPRTGLTLEDLVRVARTWEEKARSCYADDIRLTSNQFVKMLVIDASFLVELLLRSNRGMRDRIYGKQRMIIDVNHDIMLLENQLPYFTVEGMFGLLHRHGLVPLTRIIHNHFKYFWMSIPSCSRSISDSETCHFVDLLRSIHLPSVLSFPGGSMRTMDSTLSAKEIRNAGVKLKPADNNTCSLDISFANGVLTIPKIKINDITEALYRNIIVFEQCHRLDAYFIHYMRFLSCFVRSPMDAELFIEQGIIVNRRGNAEDVSKLFNSILKETSYSGFYYQAVYEDLQAYCNMPWNKWKATLRRDYFHNPWSAASVVAAIVLLLLTFIQALCSILAL